MPNTNIPCCCSPLPSGRAAASTRPRSPDRVMRPLMKTVLNVACCRGLPVWQACLETLRDEITNMAMLLTFVLLLLLRLTVKQCCSRSEKRLLRTWQVLRFRDGLCLVNNVTAVEWQDCLSDGGIVLTRKQKGCRGTSNTVRVLFEPNTRVCCADFLLSDQVRGWQNSSRLHSNTLSSSFRSCNTGTYMFY